MQKAVVTEMTVLAYLNTRTLAWTPQTLVRLLQCKTKVDHASPAATCDSPQIAEGKPASR